MFPFRSRVLFNNMYHMADLMAYNMERQFARQWRRSLDHYERQALADRHRFRDPFEEFDREISQGMKESFKEMDMDTETPPKIGKDAYYKMTMRTEENGRVRVKTMEKEPGSEWKIITEEYRRGEKPVEDAKLKTQEKVQEKVKEKIAEPAKEKPRAINETA